MHFKQNELATPGTKKGALKKGDDRNLVLVDQDFGQPDLEDRMFLFWLRNRWIILGTIAVAILGSLAALIYAAVSSYRLNALQSEYVAAKEEKKPDSLLTFGRTNIGQPLALVAILEAADQLYKDKKYDEAAKAYAAASAATPNSEAALEAALIGRAALGKAFSELYAGRAEQAVQDFNAVQTNIHFPAGVRGQALHSLAVLALEKKDFAGAEKHIETMEKILTKGDPWLAAKDQLVESVPELAAKRVAALPPATAETTASDANADAAKTAPAADKKSADAEAKPAQPTPQKATP